MNPKIIGLFNTNSIIVERNISISLKSDVLAIYIEIFEIKNKFL